VEVFLVFPEELELFVSFNATFGAVVNDEITKK
jgi:hypothetical protein